MSYRSLARDWLTELTKPFYAQLFISGLIVSLSVLSFTTTEISESTQQFVPPAIQNDLSSYYPEYNISEFEVTPTPSPTPPQPTATTAPPVQANLNGTSDLLRNDDPVIVNEIEPTPTFVVLPIDPVAGDNCPVFTRRCVPCNAGEQYCRHLDGANSGFLGWSCQNNNPGNIRYSEFRKNLIVQYGGPEACGSNGPHPGSQYMVFSTYEEGRTALGVYLEAIAQGGHSSYLPVCQNGGCTLLEFFSIYAPYGDQNNPNSYSNYVANYIGVGQDQETLRWILDNKKQQFISAIQTHEGWFTQ